MLQQTAKNTVLAFSFSNLGATVWTPGVELSQLFEIICFLLYLFI